MPGLSTSSRTPRTVCVCAEAAGGVRHGTRGADGAAEHLRQLLDVLPVLGTTQAAPARDDDFGVLQARTGCRLLANLFEYLDRAVGRGHIERFDLRLARSRRLVGLECPRSQRHHPGRADNAEFSDGTAAEHGLGN